MPDTTVYEGKKLKPDRQHTGYKLAILGLTDKSRGGKKILKPDRQKIGNKVPRCSQNEDKSLGVKY